MISSPAVVVSGSHGVNNRMDVSCVGIEGKEEGKRRHIKGTYLIEGL